MIYSVRLLLDLGGKTGRIVNYLYQIVGFLGPLTESTGVAERGCFGFKTRMTLNQQGL